MIFTEKTEKNHCSYRKTLFKETWTFGNQEPALYHPKKRLLRGVRFIKNLNSWFKPDHGLPPAKLLTSTSIFSLPLIWMGIKLFKRGLLDGMDQIMILKHKVILWGVWHSRKLIHSFQPLLCHCQASRKVSSGSYGLATIATSPPKSFQYNTLKIAHN